MKDGWSKAINTQRTIHFIIALLSLLLLFNLKNCDKTFLKNILRLLKTDDVSKLAKRHYQVKKSICEWQSISTKITMSDKKPYCEEIAIVIKRKVWHVWSPSGYLN